MGYVLKAEMAFMVLPLAISLYCGEGPAVRGFAGALALMSVPCIVLALVKGDRRAMQLRDGFAVVALCWLVASACGALPFWLSREIPSYLDALFEAISGFTTTGASILANVETLSRGMLFWRSFTHWIGGMGILIFLLAVLPASWERAGYIMKAETPGHAPGKLVPKLRQSAKTLYTIYFAVTAVQIFLLLLGGMPLFDSVVHSFGTVGTGGFSIRNASIGHYNSLYIEMVVAVFMVLSGVNFSIHYYVMVRNFSGIRRNDELRCYLGIIALAAALVAFDLLGVYGSLSEALRYGFFAVSSIITTTGYATADFSVWPQLSRVVLFLLMIIGSCSGSTGGGFKISRCIIMAREVKRVIYRAAHPRSVEIVQLDGKTVDREIVGGVIAYGCAYVLLFAASFLVLSLENFDFETTLSAVAACFNNIGPGLGAVGPAGNFSRFTALGKLVLSLDMLAGRLEIYPMLILLTPSAWRKT